MAQWTSGAFTVYTDPDRVHLDALNDAFDSDFMWWAKRLAPDDLKTMVRSSLCFSLHGPASGGAGEASSSTTTVSEPAQQQQKTAMLGLARLITDHVTFAYLTDVYILPTHQGTGLGRWLLSCVSSHVESAFPQLRGFMLLTRGKKAVSFYRATLGMAPQSEGRLRDLVVMHRDGPAAKKVEAATSAEAAEDKGAPGVGEGVGDGM